MATSCARRLRRRRCFSGDRGRAVSARHGSEDRLSREHPGRAGGRRGQSEVRCHRAPGPQREADRARLVQGSHPATPASRRRRDLLGSTFGGASVRADREDEECLGRPCVRCRGRSKAKERQRRQPEGANICALHACKPDGRQQPQERSNHEDCRETKRPNGAAQVQAQEDSSRPTVATATCHAFSPSKANGRRPGGVEDSSSCLELEESERLHGAVGQTSCCRRARPTGRDDQRQVCSVRRGALHRRSSRARGGEATGLDAAKACGEGEGAEGRAPTAARTEGAGRTGRGDAETSIGVVSVDVSKQKRDAVVTFSQLRRRSGPGAIRDAAGTTTGSRAPTASIAHGHGATPASPCARAEPRHFRENRAGTGQADAVVRDHVRQPAVQPDERVRHGLQRRQPLRQAALRRAGRHQQHLQAPCRRRGGRAGRRAARERAR